MIEDCVSIYERVRMPPHPYLAALGYCVVALPPAAGLALVAKRLKGQNSPRLALGILAATLWSVWIAINWFVPGLSQKLIPRDLTTLLSVLLFVCALGDWTMQAIRSRFRPFLSDAFVLGLIFAIPATAYAYSKVDRATICSER